MKIKHIRNKLGAIGFIATGLLPLYFDNDATFLVLALMIGIPMFFSKEDWFY